MNTVAAKQVTPRKQEAALKFWPHGWWKLMDTRIGIVPLPVYLLLVALIAGFVVTGKVPTDISVSIAILAVGGFSCAELGKRLPFFRKIGAAAIFATFIPSYLAFSHALPPIVLKNVVDFTKSTNFLYLFIASIIVGSILSMDRTVLIKGFIKIFVPLAIGSVVASIVGTLVGTCWAWAPFIPSSTSSRRSWPAASAKARSRCRSAMPASCSRTRAIFSRRCCLR